MLYEVIIELCRWLVVGLIAITGALAASIYLRRLKVSTENARQAGAEAFAKRLVSEFASGTDSANAFSDRLEDFKAHSDCLPNAILRCLTDDNRSAISRLCNDLGYISEWLSQALGGDAGSATAHFEVRPTQRAAAMHKLGLLGVDLSLKRLTPVLQNKSATVRLSMVRALARSRSSVNLKTTVKELHRSVRGQSPVPPRFVAGALAAYGVDQIVQFAELLSHPNSKIRFHAVDSVRQICSREARSGNSPVLPACINAVFLKSLSADSCDDVRARSAAVLQFIRGPQAAQTLRHLLRDPNKYVRMYASRAAIAHPEELSDELVMRLSDDYWRVREAAAQTLARAGEQTRDALLVFLQTTQDPYGWDAGMEQLQRHVDALPGSILASLQRPQQQRSPRSEKSLQESAVQQRPSCPPLNFPVLAGELFVEGAMLW